MSKKLNPFTMSYEKAQEYKEKERLAAKRGLYDRACKSIGRGITSFEDAPAQRLSLLRSYLENLNSLLSKLTFEFGPKPGPELHDLELEIYKVKAEIVECEILSFKPDPDKRNKPAWKPKG